MKDYKKLKEIAFEGNKKLGDSGLDAGAVFRLLPFVVTLVVLAFTSKNSRAPKAEGIPYDKGSR